MYNFINEIVDPFSPFIIFLASFLTSFLITFILIPPLVKIARRKDIFGKRSGRDTHTLKIPTLGGVAIFAGFIITFLIVSGINFPEALRLSNNLYLITGIIFVLFLGLIDDIRDIKPVWKLLGEMVIVLFLNFMAGIRISNLHELLGIGEIGYIPGILVTLLAFIVIINGFNLIDGIDGLASGIGIISSICFGFILYLEKQYPFVVLAVGLAGSLIAFYYFNVFSKIRKILMGDTGSLILGILQAIMAIKVLEFEHSSSPVFQSLSAPAIVFAILIIPLFDILRVTFLRIIHGRSPFRADSRHIHYRLLALGLTHIQASVILIGINILFIVLAFILRLWEVNRLIGLLFVLAALLSLLPSLLSRRTKKKVIKTYLK